MDFTHLALFRRKLERSAIDDIGLAPYEDQSHGNERGNPKKIKIPMAKARVQQPEGNSRSPSRIVKSLKDMEILAVIIVEPVPEAEASAGGIDTVAHDDSEWRLISEIDAWGNVRQEYLYLNDNPLVVLK